MGTTLIADSLPQLLAPEVEDDPPAYYKALRELDTIRFDESSGAFLLVRHEDVSAAYRDPIFTTQNYAWQLEPVMGRTILQMNGAEHAKVRGLMGPSFRGHGLSGWLGPIEQNVAGILDSTVGQTTRRPDARIPPGRRDRPRRGLCPVLSCVRHRRHPRAAQVRPWPVLRLVHRAERILVEPRPRSGGRGRRVGRDG